MPDNWNNFQTTNNPTNLDLEFLKKEVGQRFPFYDLRVNVNNAVFFCRIDEVILEEKFDSLRKSLSRKGYLPMLRHEKGEYFIYVMQKPKKKEKPVWINILLIIATIITTTLTGSILHMGYYDIWSIPNVIDVIKLDNLINGTILFAFPLMSILFVHEMGHYFVSKKHGIATSLPFFMPIPPVIPGFNIGTFGALISSSDPMSNKKSLFDIGIAGPIAGFIVAIPVTIIGILNSSVATISEQTSEQLMLGNSLLFMLLSDILLDVPAGTPINLSLIAFAGWIGLLITSINLLPAGQLDGGHIARAVLGNKQKYVSWAAIIIMVLTGWMFFAFVILFIIGLVHPPPLNDVTKLDKKRKILSLTALIILILCYIPFPLYYG